MMKKIVSLLIVLVIAFAVFLAAGCRSQDKELTGGVVKTELKCSDSDYGGDFYTKGTVKLGDKEFTDYCATRNSMISKGNKPGDLIENFCKDDKTNDYTAYNCPNGCKDGVCIPFLDEGLTILEWAAETSEVFVKCIDSDGGRNYWSKGTLSGSTILADTATDECVLMEGKPILVERICYSDRHGATINYDCSKDRKVCKEGACVSAEPLIESSDLDRVYSIISDETITTAPGCSYGGAGNYEPTSKGYINIEAGLTATKPEFEGFVGAAMYDGCDLNDKTIRIEYYCDSNGYPHRAKVKCIFGCQKDVCEFA